MAFSAPDVTENVVEKLQADKLDAFRRIRERDAANDELKKQIGAAKKKIKARRRSRPSRLTTPPNRSQAAKKKLSGKMQRAYSRITTRGLCSRYRSLGQQKLESQTTTRNCQSSLMLTSREY